ncbi:MAG: M1 family metallopeptidase [Candidatus Latescibacteria bacterium]|nr:M1 family metallopeptidase [Candidatus Latescibacterota bacterium]
MIYFLFCILSMNPQSWDNTINFEGKSSPNFQYPTDSVIEHDYNVLHYEIDIEVFEPFDSLAGYCTMTSRAEQTIDSIEYHLGMNMIIDSIMVDGVVASYTRIADTVYIVLPSTYYIDEVFSVKTYYCGEPANRFYSGYNGFFTCTESAEASKKWYPCFDQCWDKADSGVTQHITVPDTIYAVCNGLITSIDTLSGNRFTYNWDHNHPIATYLISIAAYNYTILERQHNGYTLIYYALQDYISLAQMMLDTTEVILSVYDTLIDIYPFADEKMGQCQVPGSIGMENQTCIIYGIRQSIDTQVHSHEIGHMWWGDELTCINYAQMFLNEGTNSYYESFPLLEIRGIQGFLDNITFQRRSGLDYDDSCHYPILNSPDPFGLNVYYKGAWFHHMLRNLMGDTLYFPAMREYYQTYRGGNASISELMTVMESYYGDSLDWFFHQWLEETDYPLLRVGWVHEDDTLTIRADQVQTNGPAIFRIPVEFGIWENDSITVIGPYWMEDYSHITVKLNTDEPDSVTIDPNTKLYYKLDQCIAANGVLLVDDDGTGNAQILYQTIFDELEVSIHLWNVNQNGLPGDSFIKHVKAVFWVTGTRDNPMTPDRREKIRYALENGTPVAIFSPKTPSQLQGTPFLSDTLGFTYAGVTTSDTLFQGVAGDPVGNGLRWFNIPIHNSSVLTPVTGSGTGSVYWPGLGHGIVRGENFQTVFSSIDLRWVYNMPGYSTKAVLIANILNYFGIATPVGVEEVAEIPIVGKHSNLSVRYATGGRVFLYATSPVTTELSVYDITGRRVMTWTFQGELDVEWADRGDDGNVLPQGRYFAVLENAGESKTILYLR